jgi:hypothetical protein
VIATAELGWEDEKIALILPEEHEFQQEFITHGWTVVLYAEDGGHIDKIISVLES